MAASDATNRSKVLTVGLVSPILQVNPYDSVDYLSVVICGQVFQTPYGYLEARSDLRPLVFDARLRGGAVGGTRTARVRAGLKFSDGTRVTPAHVVASLNRQWAKDHAVEVRGAGDDVVFRLGREFQDVEASLTASWCAITKDAGNELIGTGAYRVADRPDEFNLRLARNPHYLGQQGPANIDEIHFRVFPPNEAGNCDALVKAIEAGEVDYTTALSRDEASGIKGVRRLFQPGSSTCLLTFNTERPGLDDPKTRRDIASSIDRYGLASLCFENPAGFVARGLLPPRLGQHGDRISLDPAAGERLRGRPLGRPLKMLVIWAPRPYIPRPMEVAEEIKSMLGAVGIEVDIHQADDVDDYVAKIHEGDYDMALAGWIADTADNTDFLESLLHSQAIPAPARPSAKASNEARWDDPETDRMLDELRRTGRRDLQYGILDRVADQVPLLPIMYGPSVTVTSWRVQHFQPHPFSIYQVFAEIDLED